MLIKDYTGQKQKHGLLTAIERLPNYKNNRTYYKCLCDCGNTTFVEGTNFSREHTISCGCFNKKHKDYYFLREYKDYKNSKVYSVYKHTTPNGKSYIGITRQNPERRWQNGNGYSTQQYFYRAIQKYGWDNISHHVLEENLTHDEACDKEKYYINKFCTNNRKYGYNITSGGDSGRDMVNPVIQYYLGKIVNCFESLRCASNLLGICETTIRNYAENKTIRSGYSFDVLKPVYTYDVDDDFYTIRNEDHFNIKGKIQKSISQKTIARNKSRCRSINQYDLNGKYIKTFNSLKEATDESKSYSISRVLNENDIAKSAGGYMWKYDNGDYSDIEQYHANGRRVMQIDKESNKIISTYESLKEAETSTGINFKQIWKACNGQHKTSGGYIWKYAD